MLKEFTNKKFEKKVNNEFGSIIYFENIFPLENTFAEYK